MVCVCLALFAPFIAAEKADEKTTEAVVKAVVQAESTPKSKPQNSAEGKKQKIAEEATAVAKATTEVLDSETPASSFVAEEVLDKASENAKQTFTDLAEDGVSTKAAADAAARVEMETVDGASNLALSHEDKVNAEKAAIAAGKAVADHPDNQATALTEAISTVKKEEKTPGKALQKEKKKGLVAAASEAVSDLPKMAEEEADKAVQEGVSNWPGVLCILALVGGFLYFMKYDEIMAMTGNTQYVRDLKAIRAEFDNGGNGETPDCERAFIQTEYSNFNEMDDFHR